MRLSFPTPTIIDMKLGTLKVPAVLPCVDYTPNVLWEREERPGLCAASVRETRCTRR